MLKEPKFFEKEKGAPLLSLDQGFLASTTIQALQQRAEIWAKHVNAQVEISQLPQQEEKEFGIRFIKFVFFVINIAFNPRRRSYPKNLHGRC